MLEFLRKKEIPEGHRTKLEGEVRKVLKIAMDTTLRIFTSHPFNISSSDFHVPKVTFVFPSEEWDLNDFAKYIPHKKEIKLNMDKIWGSINEMFKDESKEEKEIVSGLILHEFSHHLVVNLLLIRHKEVKQLRPIKLFEDSAEYLTGCFMRELGLSTESYIKFTIKYGSRSSLKDIQSGKYLRHRRIQSSVKQIPTGWERARKIQEGYKEKNFTKGVNIVLQRQTI